MNYSEQLSALVDAVKESTQSDFLEKLKVSDKRVKELEHIILAMKDYQNRYDDVIGKVVTPSQFVQIKNNLH